MFCTGAGRGALEPSDESTARAYCELEIMGAQIFAALSKMGDAVVRTSKDGKDLEVRKLVDSHRTTSELFEYALHVALSMDQAE